MRTPIALPLSAADIATQKLSTWGTKKIYNKCQAVELALRNQLIEEIETIYLIPLQNPHTDMIKDSIPVIIKFLLNNYGQVSDTWLIKKEQDLLTYVYQLQDQPDDVLKEIDYYSDILYRKNTANIFSIVINLI